MIFTSSSYNTTEESDLFASIERAVKEDNTLDRTLSVPTIFSSWSNQKGYPLLTVERDYKKGSVTLKQGRYFSPKVSANDTSSWWIPYNYATASNANFKDTAPNGWLTQAEKSKELNGNWPSGDWVLFNKQQTGFYRVLYDEENWKLLTKQLNSDNFTNIHAINRAQLIDDAFEFAQQGLIKLNVFFDLVSYLARETDFTPWWPATRAFSTLDRLLASSKDYEKYRKFVVKITENTYKSYGIEDHPTEAHFRKYTRTLVGQLACSHGLEVCLNATYLALQNVLRSSQAPSPNSFTLIYENGIRSATDAEVNQLWDRFTKSQNDAEIDAIANSFGNVKNHALLDVYINKTIQPIDNAKIEKHTRFHLFSSIIASGQHGVSYGIRLVKNHPLEAKQYLNNLNFVVNRLAGRIVNHKLHHEVRTIIKPICKTRPKFNIRSFVISV